MRLLPAGTAVLTAAAASLWPAVILMPPLTAAAADLRSAAVTATVLAGVGAAACAAVREIKRDKSLMRERERALIRVIDSQDDSHPSGPFTAAR